MKSCANGVQQIAYCTARFMRRAILSEILRIDRWNLRFVHIFAVVTIDNPPDVKYS